MDVAVDYGPGSGEMELHSVNVAGGVVELFGL